MLVERGLVDSKTKAAALAMAGKVFSGTRKLEKPGQKLDPDTPLSLREAPHPWVSRGGIKLAHALEHFALDVTGRTALDIGASTGGFTDVLLARGAAQVYAVDVGYGQLADKLRRDNRVIVLERLNARYLTSEHVPEPVDAVVCDASFIGLRTVLPAALALAAPGAFLVALIKPQFEAGKERVGKGGIVRDPEIHCEICATMSAWLEELPGWQLLGICPSPITGAEGNKEFLLAGRFAG
ncbi:MAG: TlyA family RNA methyltransferase [Proteobacteria bacterium]|nr:TlyA family RNA methyltransferase [Pseudomonadota bacterium]MDA1355837.1 TlyA family RNA methyltransferase [Pseudomonadota bacterium]